MFNKSPFSYGPTTLDEETRAYLAENPEHCAAVIEAMVKDVGMLLGLLAIKTCKHEECFVANRDISLKKMREFADASFYGAQKYDEDLKEVIECTIARAKKET